MPATLLDSNVFKDIFTTAEMRHVFSDEYRDSHAAVASSIVMPMRNGISRIPR